MKKEKRLTQPALPELYSRILNFDVDGGTAPRLAFTDRLARENGWSAKYAARVVREYKRFLYLAATGTTAVTPSKQVDTAWHLHLTYTRSYWKNLCEDLLGKSLHHEPTRGGAEEHHRFVAQYEATLRRYAETFDTLAPEDVWPLPDECFGPAPRTLWHPDQHWVVPKPRLRPRKLLAFLPWVVAVPALLGCATLFRPLELQGTDFLLFLVPAIAVSLLVGHGLRLLLRGPGNVPSTTTLTDYQMAWIAGGAEHLAATAVASLCHRVWVRKKNGQLTSTRQADEAPTNPVDRAVMRRLPTSLRYEDRWTLRGDVTRAFVQEARTLETEGWVMTEGRRTLASLAALLPVVVIYAVWAFPRLGRGLERGKPVTFLVLTMLAGAIAAVCVLALGENRLTRRGRAWLDAQKRHARESASGRGVTVVSSVALFGVSAAAAVAVPALAGWIPPPSSSGWGSSSGCSGGSSCGGGGCGGGGCGGCGGS